MGCPFSGYDHTPHPADRGKVDNTTDAAWYETVGFAGPQPGSWDRYLEADKMAREDNTTVYQRIDKFHAHLDICSQCYHHPFALCSTGARLLEEAATIKKGES